MTRFFADKKSQTVSVEISGANTRVGTIFDETIAFETHFMSCTPVFRLTRMGFPVNKISHI
jgi:hypothetical protein